MNMLPTMTSADLYGPTMPSGRKTGTGQTTGKTTSAEAGLVGGGSPAMVWIGLVILLVAARVLIDLNK